jgi:protein-S-isoprenylcysteine O-methyltransferase Ste14
MIRFGGWLFRHRTAIPLPLALAVLLIPGGETTLAGGLFPAGLLLIGAGEALRFWAVRQIGAISRTRSDRLGPLVDTGPFAVVRNPLYIGNIVLWTGFALAARLPWLVPLIVVLLGIEYHAIVRWEEQLLAARIGPPYRAYLTRVPRWLPVFGSGGRQAARESPVPRFSWRETIYSERGTLIGIAVGLVLLSFKP